MTTDIRTLIRRLPRKLLVRTLWLLLGRRNLVRLARVLTNESRLDNVAPHLRDSNGESLLQETIVRRAPHSSALIVIDVGANVGQWTLSLLRIARAHARQNIRVHAFEPSLESFQLLKDALRADPWGDRVVAVQMGVSDEPGVGQLHIVGRAGPTNSLYAPSTGQEAGRELIQLTTLDSYCHSAQIARVTLLKVDAEGHDKPILMGAGGLFRNRAIDMVQFEYTQRWIDARAFLRDIFDFLGPLGYRIGKLTPRGVEFYPDWHPELETFRLGNYLACKAEFTHILPTIDWWGAALFKTRPGSSN